MKAFVFPGQGAQKRGMGGDLFDRVPEFLELEPQIDALLGYSVRELCLHDSARHLRDTRFTQPALFVTNALHYFQACRQGARPQLLAGHSLGEFNALMAAGVFDFLTGVQLVHKRAALMAEVTGGGMLAVVGLPADRVRQIVTDAALPGLDVANDNSPNQTVVAGPEADLERAHPVFEQCGASMVVRLAVSGPFHSRYMAAAAEAFRAVLSGCRFSVPSLPVISNVTGEPYPQVDSSQSVASLLSSQMTHPVQWVRSVATLLRMGATDFLELGPGTVLSRLIQENRPSPLPSSGEL